MVAVLTAAVATFAIYHLSARITAAKDRELEEYRTESQIKIADAEAAAAEAMKIAESERRARADLEHQLAIAEARAAEANAVASQAQLDLAKLKEPRTIASKDREKMIATLKKFAGQQFSFSVFQDPEALDFLKTLDAVLKLAGWIRVPHQIGSLVVNVAGNTASASFLSGVVAFIRPDNRGSEPALLALGTALTNAGIPCKPYRYERLKGETPKAIHIHVG